MQRRAAAADTGTDNSSRPARPREGPHCRRHRAHTQPCVPGTRRSAVTAAPAGPQRRRAVPPAGRCRRHQARPLPPPTPRLTPARRSRAHARQRREVAVAGPAPVSPRPAPARRSAATPRRGGPAGRGSAAQGPTRPRERNPRPPRSPAPRWWLLPRFFDLGMVAAALGWARLGSSVPLWGSVSLLPPARESATISRWKSRIAFYSNAFARPTSRAGAAEVIGEGKRRTNWRRWQKSP